MLLECGEAAAAAASYEQALALKPDYAEAYSNLGDALTQLKQLEAAAARYAQAFALKPDLDYLIGTLLHAKMHLCDWSGLESMHIQLVEKIARNEKVVTPFASLSLFDSLVLQKKAAEIWVAAKYPSSNALPKLVQRDLTPGRDKIRIGYFSGDFRHHPTAYLTAELFEMHDRSRFELTAFSFGPDTQDAMRTRVAAAFGNFIDVRNQSDKEVALLAQKLEIDIAIDLDGYTKHSRTGIFSLQAAPVQVSYLGYPGTMGGEYIDYIFADSTVIPVENQPHYSEKIVYLPFSYQVNDSQRVISSVVFTRAELGLPESGFVFCCFNNNYKITPGTFAGWMRILKQVPGSVLWLFEDNPMAALNLRKAAQRCEVSPERLVFAQRMPLPEHLARHRLADLCLDTLPYNAHTTASDALWTGLPVLTLIGEPFASRVAASLLKAVEMPELITETQEAYEALAIELASQPGKLTALKAKLQAKRLSTPLFDTALFTRHIEEAYRKIHERHLAGLPPEPVYVSGASCLVTEV